MSRNVSHALDGLSRGLDALNVRLSEEEKAGGGEPVEEVDMRALLLKALADVENIQTRAVEAAEQLKAENEQLKAENEQLKHEAYYAKKQRFWLKSVLQDTKELLVAAQNDSDRWRSLYKAAKQERAVNERSRSKPDEALSQSRVDLLLQLCHPDRHDNSERSNEITRWLLSIRKK